MGFGHTKEYFKGKVDTTAGPQFATLQKNKNKNKNIEGLQSLLNTI